MISAPVAATSSGRIALTVAAVPTGMKAGVSIVPCAVVDAAAPRRAVARQEREGEARSCRAAGIEQAGIAIGEEAIALARRHAHRRAFMRSSPAKARDQHEQGRARQMEIGQQQIDRAEAIARRDEERGLAGERRDRAARRRRRFRAGAALVVPTATMRPPRRARGVEARRGRGVDRCPIRRACGGRRCRRP